MLEKRLWEERQAIQKRHEEKVKLARTKYVPHCALARERA